MTITEVSNLLTALAATVAAFTGAWSVIVSKRGVAVSTRNETALSDVQAKQTLNKVEIKDEIKAVRHDLHNGGGVAIAAAVVEKIKPVLEETGKTITTQVAQNNAEVAAALAEKHASTWDGVERRIGPADRRGQ